MAIKVKWKSVWITLLFGSVLVLIDGNGVHPHDIERFSQVRSVPTKVHIRGKRDLNHPNVHPSHAELRIELDGQPRIVDLILNHQLLAKDVFLKAEHGNQTHDIYRFGQQHEELCQYHGTVREIPGSSAAISLCDGIRGAIFTGNGTFFLERSATPGETLVYDSNYLIHSHNHSCGFPDTPRSHRVRRDTDEIRGPYNENAGSRYVELVFVVDMEEFKDKGEDLQKVYRHCKDIANIINSLFVPLNIFIALVGVVVWTDANQIKLSTNGDTTLTNFLHYRRERLVKEHPNDNAQLLTKIKFEGGVVGKALKGPICTYEFSGGVSMDHSPVLGLVATTIAHEMGHNFGMEHDNADCDCPDEKCIMAPSSSQLSPSHWSSCSLEYLAHAFEHGMDYCLRNKPTHLFDSPQCGNGFVEPGEQCDCGMPEHCNNACCNPSTCMLYPNATCATGRCCNFNTCQPMSPGRQCRSAVHECDLPEFCTGESEYCPDDVYKMNGETCRAGKAYCYEGKCRTHSDQCKLLWGDSGNNSDDECYDKNMLGTRHGNCGFHRLNNSYVKCDDTHIQCGMLHCKHQNERLEFGMESVSNLAHTFINKAGTIVPCRTAMVDLGLNEIDPGLAPDGAKCGENMMCVNQKCMSVGELRAMGGTTCPEDCNGNGVCNSRGHCHCVRGFAPPLCKYPGTGGSEDSGPASDPNATKDFATALYVIFLGVIPALAAIGLLYLYWKRDPRLLGGLKPPTTISSNALLDHRVGDKPIKHEADTTLSAEKLMDGGTNSFSVSPVQKELIGQFRGFSIKAIVQNEQDQSQATNLLPQNVRSPVAGITKTPGMRNPNRWANGTAVKPPSAPHVVFTNPKPKPLAKAPEVCRVDIGSIDIPDAPQRLEISKPVLADTTSHTAKELIENAPLQPTRPAPSVPKPMTVPEETAPMPPQPPPMQPTPQEPREFPTLTRIANIMRNASLKTVNEKQRKPRIDREKLRGLEISNPIPQTDTEPSEAKERVSVQRAQSMREATPPRQPLTFGSMRSGKRPTSVHVPARPTAPPPQPPPQPPPPPPPASSKPSKEHSYDDCLNLLSEKQAPLAHIDEESSPTSPHNIYAVIEESPPHPQNGKSEKSVRFTDSRYEVPKSPLVNEKPLSTSTESMGLLGEIVNEIQSRNIESIYSAGTLKRKKKEAEERRLKDAGRYENAGAADEAVAYQPSDVSSTSSSNGYLNPKNINVPVTASATDSKLKDIDIATYKPYSSSFVRNSGPLSMAYARKTDEPTASVAGTFARPGLLSAPTPTKFTPHSITSSFRAPKLNGTVQMNGGDAALPTIANPVQDSTKPSISDAKSKIPPKVAPRPKDKVQRPLPSIPKKPVDSAAPTKPLPALPKIDVDVKPGFTPKKPSDFVKQRVSGNKPSPPNAALKPKLNTITANN